MEAAFSEAWKVLSDPKGAALERRAPTPLAPPEALGLHLANPD